MESLDGWREPSQLALSDVGELGAYGDDSGAALGELEGLESAQRTVDGSLPALSVAEAGGGREIDQGHGGGPWVAHKSG
jgi:hypothetical protein